jgi:hypothetical protein
MKDRDDIIAPASSSSGSPKRADTLNGSPRTKSIDGGGANYSPHKSSKLNSAPPPNNPYSK